MRLRDDQRFKGGRCRRCRGLAQLDAIKLCCNGHALADGDSLVRRRRIFTGRLGRFIKAIVQSVLKPGDRKGGGGAADATTRGGGGAGGGAAAAATTTAVDDAKLGQLVDMGFDRATAVSALSASAGDVSRAVDLLMGGGPIPPPSSSSSSSGSGGGESSSGSSGSSGARARALRGLAGFGSCRPCECDSKGPDSIRGADEDVGVDARGTEAAG